MDRKPTYAELEKRVKDLEHRQAGEAQKSERELLFKEDLIRSSSSIIATCDLEGNMTYGNPSFLKTWGFEDAKEFLGRHFSEFWEVKDRLDDIMKTLQTEDQWFGKIQARRKDGTFFDVQVSAATVYDVKGNPIALTSTSIDITDRRQAEEALRESEAKYADLYDNAPDMYVSVDAETALISQCNQTLANKLGYKKEEIVGRPIFDMYHSDSMDKTKEVFRSFVETGEVHDIELQLKRKDGKKIDVSLNASAVRDENGEIQYSRSSWRDITERKRAEEKIIRSLEYFQLLSDLANTFIKLRPSEFGKTIEHFIKLIVEFFDVDRGTLMYWPEGDPGSRELYSWSKEGITPFRWENIHNKFVYLAERLRKGEIFSFSNIDDLPSEAEPEKDYFLSKGYKSAITIPMTVEGRLLGVMMFNSFRKTKTWSNDLVQYLQFIAQTFTYSLERKHAEELLRESEERFRSFMDSATEGFSLWDSALNLIAVNDAGIKLLLFGEKAEDILGKNILEISSDLKETGRYDQHLTVIKSGEPNFSSDLIHYSKFGERYLDVKTFKVGEGLGMIVEDVTERNRAEAMLRESEEKYRLLINNYNAAIVVFDLDGTVLIMNHSAAEGLDGKPEDFVGRKLSEYLLNGTYLTERNRRIIKSGKAAVFEDEVELPSGKKWFWSNIQPVKDTNDKPYAVQVISYDITERKDAEEEKSKLQAQLQQAQKMEAIAILAGGIAHQFNNALSGITGYIDILGTDYPNDENIVASIKPMKDSANRMTRLTSQLLAYARGGKYLAKTISLSDFVRDTLPLLRHTIDPLIDLDNDLPHDVFCIKADLTQMQMVLAAILSNASEAIEGKGRIRIICRNERVMDETAEDFPGLKPGNYVSLAIEDDGKGMDKETKMRIFEPFFTTKFQGRGLGMAAAYGIINNHDGLIHIDSELDKGTKVCIYLPAVEEMIKEPKEPSVEITIGTGNILVIEDEDIVMDVIRAMLEKLGYRVLAAKTGSEAIDIVENFDGDIDLALLDMKLPDMEGGKVYPIIKKSRPNLKVIVCSGYAVDGPAQDILDSGAQDFMQKPFSLSTLSEKLHTILGKEND